MARRSRRGERLGTCALLAATFIGVNTSPGSAQLTTRVAILQAEDRRAASPQDLAIPRPVASLFEHWADWNVLL